jgi:hypothetical protein
MQNNKSSVLLNLDEKKPLQAGEQEVAKSSTTKGSN